jgi:hypothetical protein
MFNLSPNHTNNYINYKYKYTKHCNEKVEISDGEKGWTQICLVPFTSYAQQFGVFNFNL